MKKTLMLMGVGVLLASCGSTQVGSAKLTITGLRTEYRTTAGAYVACDNVAYPDGTTTSTTQVAAAFNATGDVSSVQVALHGNSTAKYDNNYVATFTREQLDAVGGNDFVALFDADASKNVLPQSITVNPARRYIKIVTPVGDSPGSFRTDITLTNEGNSGTAFGLTNIAVYTGCNVTSKTDEQL